MSVGAWENDETSSTDFFLDHCSATSHPKHETTARRTKPHHQQQQQRLAYLATPHLHDPKLPPELRLANLSPTAHQQHLQQQHLRPNNNTAPHVPAEAPSPSLYHNTWRTHHLDDAAHRPQAADSDADADADAPHSASPSASAAFGAHGTSQWTQEELESVRRLLLTPARLGRAPAAAETPPRSDSPLSIAPLSSDRSASARSESGSTAGATSPTAGAASPPPSADSPGGAPAASRWSAHPDVEHGAVGELDQERGGQVDAGVGTSPPYECVGAERAQHSSRRIASATAAPPPPVKVVGGGASPTSPPVAAEETSPITAAQHRLIEARREVLRSLGAEARAEQPPPRRAAVNDGLVERAGAPRRTVLGRRVEDAACGATSARPSGPAVSPGNSTVPSPDPARGTHIDVRSARRAVALAAAQPAHPQSAPPPAAAPAAATSAAKATTAALWAAHSQQAAAAARSPPAMRRSAAPQRPSSSKSASSDDAARRAVAPSRTSRAPQRPSSSKSASSDDAARRVVAPSRTSRQQQAFDAAATAGARRLERSRAASARAQRVLSLQMGNSGGAPTVDRGGERGATHAALPPRGRADALAVRADGEGAAADELAASNAARLHQLRNRSSWLFLSSRPPSSDARPTRPAKPVARPARDRASGEGSAALRTDAVSEGRATARAPALAVRMASTNRKYYES